MLVLFPRERTLLTTSKAPMCFRRIVRSRAVFLGILHQKNKRVGRDLYELYDIWVCIRVRIHHPMEEGTWTSLPIGWVSPY